MLLNSSWRLNKLTPVRLNVPIPVQFLNIMMQLNDLKKVLQLSTVIAMCIMYNDRSTNELHYMLKDSSLIK